MFLKSVRALADNPVVIWAKALLNLATALVAVLTLFLNVPILPPEVVQVIATIIVSLNAVIEFLKLLVPAS
jgi:hypothetical protein